MNPENSENNAPLISIQILNWNRAEDSLRAIESAVNQTYPNTEIIFVDNGSTDNSVALVKEKYPAVTIVSLDSNYGCPDGRNRGIEYCNGDFIFYLDNDGVLHKEAVQKAYDTIKKDKSIAVIAGVVYDFDSPTEIDPQITPRSEKQYEFSNFQGGICMHRKRIYQEIGNYPSHFFYGGEEWYLTCKILDNGLKIIKDESIILWHKRSDVARNRENELLNSYYNKLYVSISLYPLRYALAFMLYFPFKYLKYAKIEGIGKAYKKAFFGRYFSTVKKAFKERNPIKNETYKKLKNR